jgi:hypothetical protein
MDNKEELIAGSETVIIKMKQSNVFLDFSKKIYEYSIELLSMLNKTDIDEIVSIVKSIQQKA